MTDELSRDDVAVVGPLLPDQYFVMAGIMTIVDSATTIPSIEQISQTGFLLSYLTDSTSSSSSNLVLSSSIIGRSLTELMNMDTPSTNNDLVVYCRCIDYTQISSGIYRARIAVYMAIGRTPIGYLAVSSSGVLITARDDTNTVIISMTNSCHPEVLYAGNPFSIVREDYSPIIALWDICSNGEELVSMGFCTQSYYRLDSSITPIFIAIPTLYYQEAVSCQQAIAPTIGGLPSPVSSLQCKLSNSDSEYSTSSYCGGIDIINGYTYQRDCYYSGSVIYVCSNIDNPGCGTSATYSSLTTPISDRDTAPEIEVRSSYGSCSTELYCGFNDQFQCINPPPIPVPPPPPPVTDDPGPRYTPRQIIILTGIIMLIVIIIGIIVVGIILLTSRSRST